MGNINTLSKCLEIVLPFFLGLLYEINYNINSGNNDNGDVNINISDVSIYNGSVNINIDAGNIDGANVNINIGSVNIDNGNVNINIGSVNINNDDVNNNIGSVNIDNDDVNINIGACNITRVATCDALPTVLLLLNHKFKKMAKSSVRVKIPRNPERLIALAASVYKKHLADGVKSPLQTLSDYNWTDNGPKIAEAEALETQAKQLEKDVEELYRQRDLLLVPINLTVKSSRDNLLGIYKANYKKLGDWGFVVDDTPRAKKPTDTP